MYAAQQLLEPLNEQIYMVGSMTTKERTGRDTVQMQP